MTSQERETLTLAEAAAILGPSASTLRRRAKETGYIDAGRTVKVLDFGPQSLYVREPRSSGSWPASAITAPAPNRDRGRAWK